MSELQSVLGWLYIFLCLVIIWYGISLLLTLWQWLVKRTEVGRLNWALLKLAVTILVARAVIWAGATLSAASGS